MKNQNINLPLLFIVLITVAFFATVGVMRLKIDTDVTKSLPVHEKVISDALDIFHNHPIHDQIAVDIAIDKSSPEALVQCANLVKRKLQASGLFVEVGMDSLGSLIPGVSQDIVHQLPLLFSRDELEMKVAPLLSPAAVEEHLAEAVRDMTSLDGIGRSNSLGQDPLALNKLVLAKLSSLAPSTNGRIYEGNLIANDNRHLLLTAKPAAASANTDIARQLTQLFTEAQQEINSKLATSGIHAVLTPTGAYRAALDNETIIRHDVQLALGLSTAGIALLLFLAFPRPLFSLLSLVPPIAGTAAALFVYSLFHSSISIMVLGFAGALISIMDDFSITFLLFLDRPKATKGQDAADEVQSVGGGVCLLTTIASFLVLGLSDFPVFAALGEFTALGLIFTYLFIHFLSPRILPQMPPARRSNPPLHRISGLLFSFGKPGFVAAILFISVMLVFAKPHFRMNLADMNTVSAKTQEEDQRFTEIWGNMGQKVYLMATASSPALLQEANDSLVEQFALDKTTNRIDNAFVTSMIYPGRQLAAQNLEAWHQFWNTKRTTSLQATLTAAGMEAGFTADAFTAFYQLLAPGFTIESLPLPEQYFQLLGITRNHDGRLVQFVSVTPGSKYHADGFQETYGKKFKIFDSAHFSDRLGDILLTTFMQSLGIMSVIISLMLFLYFLNWQLTLITLLPLVFAYVATLGTLHLIGHPLDIPGLMLTVVILGLGIDYTIYTVCGYQRYGSSRHSNFVLLRSAVLLSATSTLIGFGVLCFADHSTLRSVGITSLCGIGYSLLGTLLLLPPLLDWYYKRENLKTIPTANLEGKILQRYRLLPTYPRLFARIKLHSDPLFGELAGHLKKYTHVKNILDIGCGYGLPASWCIENFPDSSICGLDPDGEKVFIAQRAVRDRGTMITGAAPQLPGIPTGLDLVLMLDMMHYLSDADLLETFRRCCEKMADNGYLIARFVIRPEGKRSFYWYVEDMRAKYAGITTSYRNIDILKKIALRAGFQDVQVSSSSNPELFWLTGRFSAATFTE